MKWRCRLGFHHIETAGLTKFSYCTLCDAVWWWPGTGYWDLDICDTQYYYDSVRVQ